MGYDCQRYGTRVDHERKCYLSHNGVKYSCHMKNISISGALVCVPDFPLHPIQSGDTCGLFLTAEPTQAPVEYMSRVARLESSKIGLQFLGMTF
jgi:PilZ domain